MSRTQASRKALSALGTKRGAGPVIVFGLKSSSPAGARVTQGAHKKLVLKAGRERAYFFYEDLGPFRSYPHPGRVALVGAKSGKAKVSKVLSRAPRVNGRLPAFLKDSSAYRSSSYRIFARLAGTLASPLHPGDPAGTPSTAPNKTPDAGDQTLVAKQNRPKHISLQATDDNQDFLLYAITEPPSHGALSGAPPDLIYTPDPGFLGKDKFAFKAYDGTSQSNTAHVTIDVRPLGLPPTVTTSAGCTAYNAGTAAVVVDPLATVTDPDDTTLDSVTVRFANFQDGDDLLFTDQNGISGSYDDSTGTLTLIGTASLANYQAAIRSVRYRNVTGSPSATKDIQFTANDAGNDSAPATKQVCVAHAGPNRRPTGEAAGEGPLNYTENDGPVPVDASFIALDPDSANLSGATIRFASSQGSTDEETGSTGGGGTIFNFFPGEDRLGFVDQNGITGSYDSTTGVLTLTGSASVADYQTALQSVTYENTSENPAADVRTVRFQVTDSSGATSVPSTRDVYVTPVNDAPFVTTSSGSTSYTEGDPATAVDPALTAGDVDNTTLTGGQVRISSGFQPGDTLAFTNQSGITGSYDPDTGILTLTGTATTGDYQAALQSIQFQGTSDVPTSSKTVEFVVNDGQLDSSAATKDIAVTPVNDPPALTPTASALSYSENGGPVAADPGITVSDPDSASFAGATVQITGNPSTSQDQLGFSDQSGITGSYDNGTGTLTLSGSASVSEYQAALQSVTYENTSDNPSTDTRTVTFQVDDGGSANNLSNAATRDISITASNDAPAVATSDGSTSYTTGDTTGIAVDGAVTATDVDDANLESATVRISSGFQSGDELVFADQSTITGAYNGTSGVLTLSGSASVEDYQAALESVAFRTTDTTSSDPRTVEFVVNDGDAASNAATKTVDITAPVPNDAPVVTTSPGSTAYGNGDAAVAVDSGVTVTDANDTNLESARVTISGGFEGGDTLTFEDQNNIFGTYDPESGALTLTGTATVEQYQAALQSIKFQTSGAAVQPSKTISFVVNDGDADSNTATKTIDVGPPTL